MEILMDEVSQAPPAMIEEVLDFVRFLKAKRFSPASPGEEATADDTVEIIFNEQRTLSDLADEQRAFQASLALPLVDLDLPSEE
jgi:hypothetical protein